MDENTTLVKTRSVSSDYGSSYQDIPLNDSASLRQSIQRSSGDPGRNTTETTDPEIHKFKKITIGYIFVFLINIGYTLSLITAQISVGETSIFELNLMRFTFEALVSLCLIKCCGHSFRIKWKDLYLILLLVITYYVYNICYYYSPTVLPVGNLQAMFTTVLIVCAVVVDLVFKYVNRSAIVSAVICVSGMLLLIQPWDYKIYKDMYGMTPCKVWDTGCSMGNSSNGSSCLNMTFENGPNQFFFGLSVDGTILGYFLVLFGAIGLALTFNIIRKMSFTYPVPVIIFWVDILLCALSLITTAISLGDNWTFPSGYWCILATVGFVVLTVIDNLLCFYGYHYLPVSQVTLGVAPTTVSLYICQRTFLKDFYPGHANSLEELGIALIVIGATLSQFLAIFGDCGRFKRQVNAMKEQIDNWQKQ